MVSSAFVYAVLYGMFFTHLCKQSSRWKESSTTFHLLDCLHKCVKNIPYKTACTNGLPGDEHVMFETWRWHEELSYNSNFKKVCVLLVYVTYRVAIKSLARPDWKHNWKVAIFRPTRRSLLPPRPGWTDNFPTFFFFLWLAEVRVWSLQLVSFLVGLRTYQHPGDCITMHGTKTPKVPVLQFAPVSTFPPTLSTHSLIYHRRCINPQIDIALNL